MMPPVKQDTVLDLPRQPDIRRILIIKWGGMGDVVISTAIMQDIYRAFPHAELHLNTLPAWKALFDADPRFREVWCVDLRGKERGVKSYMRWCRQVMARQYDLIIDLQTSDKSRLLLSMLKLTGQAPRHLLGNHPVFPYTIRQQQSLNAAHGLHIMRQTLAAGGILTATLRPVLHPAPTHTHEAHALLQAHGLMTMPFAIFLCGSHAAGLAKRWGASNFVSLAHTLQQQGITRVALIGGPDEAAECSAIAALCPEIAINLCGQTSLLSLPALFAQATCIIANDTGTAHLAAASSTPMLVICGPTNPARVKPIGPQVTALQADLPCKNCYQKTCSHHSCMQGFTADKLLPFLAESMGQKAETNSRQLVAKLATDADSWTGK